jgi:hypothetical protein
VLALAIGCHSQFSTAGSAGAPTASLEAGGAGSEGAPTASLEAGGAGSAGAPTVSLEAGGAGSAGAPTASLEAGGAGSAGAPTASLEAGGAGSAGTPSFAGAKQEPIAGSAGVDNRGIPKCPPCAPGICGSCTTAAFPDCDSPVFVYCF